jgi:hypothetical protein
VRVRVVRERASERARWGSVDAACMRAPGCERTHACSGAHRRA